MRRILPLCLILLLTSCQTSPRKAMQQPPLPPGAHFKARHHSSAPPRALAAPVPLAAPQPGFRITNIVVISGQVTLGWQNTNAVSPVMVQQAPLLTGPWTNVGFPTAARTKTFVASKTGFLRLQGAVPTFHVTNGQPRGIWSSIEVMPATHIAQWDVKRVAKTGQAVQADFDAAPVWQELTALTTVSVAHQVPLNNNPVDVTVASNDAFNVGDYVTEEGVGQYEVMLKPTGQLRLRYVEQSKAPNNTHSGETVPVGKHILIASFRDPEQPTTNNLYYQPWGYTADDLPAKANPIKQNFGGLSFTAPLTFRFGVHAFGVGTLTFINGIAVDVLGNILVTGYFSGTADFGGLGKAEDKRTAAGSRNVFIAKYTPSGALVWVTSIGASGTGPSAYGIAVDSLGNPIVTGAFRGSIPFGSITLTSVGGVSDIFIAKLSGSDGSVTWAKRFGSANSNAFGRVVKTIANDVILGGEFSGDLVFPSTTLTGGTSDILLVKLSGLDGSVIAPWPKQFGGAAFFIKGLELDTLGNIVISGRGGTGGNLGGASLPEGMVFAKYDSSGVHQWSKGLGGQSADAITVDRRNNRVIVSGGFNSTVNLGGGDRVPPSGGGRAFVACYDADGAYQWDIVNGSGADDTASAVGISGDKLAFAGICRNTMNFGTGFLFGNGYFIVGFTVPISGNPTFVKAIRSQGGTSTATGLIFTPIGPISAGWFQDALTFNSSSDGPSYYATGGAAKDGFVLGYDW